MSILPNRTQSTTSSGKTNKNNNNNNKKKQSSSGAQKRQVDRFQALNSGSYRDAFNPQVLSAATTAYLHAASDPFEAPPCAVPNSPALMTAPRKVWSKGSFSSSTVPAALDTGFIVISPETGMVNDLAVGYTNSAALAVPNVNLGASVATFSNSEFTSAALGPNAMQARVVSVGLRIRNITPSLTRGGQCIGLTEPAHGSVNGFTVAIMDSYNESERHGGKELSQWLELIWHPVDTDDYDFVSVPNVTPCMGFIVTAPSASPQTYEYEIYGIYEYQGRNVIGKVFSVADSRGYEAVANTIVSSPKLHKSHTRDERLPEATHKAATHMLTHHMSGNMSKKKEVPEKDKSFLSTVLGMAPSIFNLVSSIF